MRNMTAENEYEPILIDDGTLDTVVSVNGREYRYTWVDPGPMYGDMDERYADFVKWAMQDAVQQHEEASE